MTKKNAPCPIEADRNRGGSWYCHVHDPEGKFRQQHQHPKSHRGQSTLSLSEQVDLLNRSMEVLVERVETLEHEMSKMQMPVSSE